MSRFAIGPLIATGLLTVLLMGPFASQLEVNADTERDLFRAMALFEHGQWPDGGPAVDYLPVTLGPGWYLVVGPALLIQPDPHSVHVVHVILLVIGLLMVWTPLEALAGAWGALAIGLLIATSRYLTDVLVRLWHNGMVPGVALIWLGLLWNATAGPDPRTRARWLAGAWLVTALLLQLHLVNGAYAVVLGLATLAHWRRFLWWTPVASSLTALVAGGLLVGYSLVFFGLDWAQVGALRESRLGGDATVSDVVLMLSQVVGPAWSNLDAIGWAVLALALVGAAEALYRWRSWGFDQWIVLLAALGLTLAVVASGLAVAPRYFAAAVPAIWVLAARAIGLAVRHLPVGWSRHVAGATLCTATAFGSLAGLMTPIESAPPLESPLTLQEQRLAVDAMLSRGVALERGGPRGHGAIFGPLTATRYLAWARSEATRSDATDDHIFVAPLGWPEPSGPKPFVLDRQEIDGGSARPLVVIRHRARYEPIEVRARVGSTPCPIVLPWRWSHLTADELTPFGIRVGPGVEQCRHSQRDAPLTLEIPPVRGKAPLHLVVQWFDVAGRRADRATLTATTTRGRPIETKRLGDDRLRHAAMWTLEPKPGQGLRLDLAPLDTLAAIDVF